MITTKDNNAGIAITRNKDGQVYLALARRSPNRKILAVEITDFEARRVIEELTVEFRLTPPRAPTLLERLFGTVNK